MSAEQTASHSLSADELRTAVAEAAVSIPQRHKQMLTSILDLERVTVDDIMVQRNEVSGIDITDDWDQILEQLRQTQHTRMPLYEGELDQIVGLLHMKNVARELARGKLTRELLIEIASAREAYFVPAGTTLNTQLQNFQRNRRRLAFVVDEYGDVQGIVTLEDILEEIVGEIADEHEVTVHGVRPQPDGSINVDGSVPIRDLNRATGWELPDDQANTIAGLVIHEARIIPEPGQAFTFHGYRFQVLRKNKNRVTALRITPLNRVKPAPGPGAGPASTSAPAATA
jgi:Mg2+/Co2+ transporter CorB